MYGGIKGQDDFVVDSLGVGVGAAGELIKRGHAVVLYQGGASSADPKKWRNRRVQSYLSLRNMMRDGVWKLMPNFFDSFSDWDEFDAQCCSIRVLNTNDRVEDLVTKQAMADDGIPSPDMADAFAMQHATQTPAMLPGGADSVKAPEVLIIESDLMRGIASL
jgi:hypothetical protein